MDPKSYKTFGGLLSNIFRIKSILILILIFTGNIMANGNNTKKILVVAGGKQFEEKQFYEMFSSFNDVVFDTASKPRAFDIFNSGKIKEYMAVIFYDTYQPITGEQKTSFLNIFNLGIGCVFLHHAMVSHQEWEEYENIIGGRYYHDTYYDDGKKYGPSTYKHDQDFNVIIIDKNNPITKGIDNFPLHDEIYINYKVHKNVTPILSIDNCESNKYIGWIKTYNKSRIVVLQPGHDHFTYENPNYREIVGRSIDWVSEKKETE